VRIRPIYVGGAVVVVAGAAVVVDGANVVVDGATVVVGGAAVVVVAGAPVVVVPVPVVVGVVPGEAAAWAGTTTECTTGRVHDFGRIPSAVPAPTVAPIAFSSGRRLISLVILKYPQRYNATYDQYCAQPAIDLANGCQNRIL
jgi:hypothetical protein